MSENQISTLTSVAGIIGGLLTFGIPLLAWRLALRPWKAVTRLQWAAKGAIWPAVVLSFGFARPVMHVLFGIGNSDTLTDTVFGFLGGLLICSPIGAIVGWVAHSSRNSQASQNNG